MVRLAAKDLCVPVYDRLAIWLEWRVCHDDSWFGNGFFLVHVAVFNPVFCWMARWRLVLVPVKRKRIAYQEILSIELTATDRLSKLTIESTNQPLTFGSSHGPYALEELCEYLMDEVPIPERAPSLPVSVVDGPVRLQRRTVKPESSQWQLEAANGQAGTTFVNQGKFQLGATLLLLGIALFWNGIVGVFVVEVIQAWRGLGDQPASVMVTVFLIPFVLIGSVMFFLLFFTLLEPFRKTVCRFSSREIFRQSGYCGISRTKTWPVTAAVTMELELELEDVPESDGLNYSLKFSQVNEKLMEVSELTLAEACWIATEIETRQSSFIVGPSSDYGAGFKQELAPQKNSSALPLLSPWDRC